MRITSPGIESLLTVQELANRLNVPNSWVYQRARARGCRRLPSIKMGKYVRFEWTAVQAWLDDQRRENVSVESRNER